MADDRLRALILAAGRGERLRPLTDDRPKCLLSLAGRPLLDWQLQALRDAAVSDVAIVVGWQGQQVARRGLVCFENPNWERTSMVASLLAGTAWLERGPCVVAYGDVVYHPEIVRRLAGSSHDVAISYDLAWRSLWKERFVRPEEDAETLRVEDGLVRDIGGAVHDLDGVDGQFMGLLRLTPAGLEQIQRVVARLPEASRPSLDTTHLLGRLIAEGVSIGAVPVRGQWCEVDRPEDLDLYEDKLREGCAWPHDWRSPGSWKGGELADT